MISANVVELPGWIRILRKNLGLTQDQFAERLGVTFVTVSRWENGQARPNKLGLRTLWGLAEGTGVARWDSCTAGRSAGRERTSRAGLPPPVAGFPPRGGAASAHGVKDFKPRPRAADQGQVDLLAKSAVFSSLDTKQLVELSRLAVERRLKPGQFLFFEGDAVEYCYLVASGMVKVLHHSASGTDFISAVYGPGELLGVILLLAGKRRHPTTAQAVTDGRVLVIRGREFAAFLNRYPGAGFKISQKVLSISSKRHAAMVRRLSELAAARTDYRLAHVLLGLCLEFGSTIPLTRHEIAEMAGTTTETAARFVSRLRQTGVVSSFRGKVVVLEQEKLRLLAGLPPK